MAYAEHRRELAEERARQSARDAEDEAGRQALLERLAEALEGVGPRCVVEWLDASTICVRVHGVVDVPRVVELRAHAVVPARYYVFFEGDAPTTRDSSTTAGCAP